MYNGPDTDAGQALKNLCALPYKLDVTDSGSVTEFRDYVNHVIQEHPNYSK